MRNFRDLEIWKSGLQIAIDFYPNTEDWPDIHKFRLTAQILGSSTAIPANIAEGCGRSSNKDLKRYLEYALGEAYEFETQLIIAHSYRLLSREITQEFIDRIQTLQKMITAFIRSLQD